MAACRFHYKSRARRALTTLGLVGFFYLSLSQVLAQLDVLLALFAEPKAMELCELAKKGKLKHSDEAIDAVPRALELCFLGLMGLGVLFSCGNPYRVCAYFTGLPSVRAPWVIFS